MIAASIRISIVLIYCGPTTENYRRLSNRQRLETVIVNKVEEKLIANFRLIHFFKMSHIRKSPFPSTHKHTLKTNLLYS